VNGFPSFSPSLQEIASLTGIPPCSVCHKKRTRFPFSFPSWIYWRLFFLPSLFFFPDLCFAIGGVFKEGDVTCVISPNPLQVLRPSSSARHRFLFQSRRFSFFLFSKRAFYFFRRVPLGLSAGNTFAAIEFLSLLAD